MLALGIPINRTLVKTIGTPRTLGIQGFMYLFVDGLLANLSIELATYVVLKNTYIVHHSFLH